MSGEQQPNQNSLVPSGNRALVARSSTLVKRGLELAIRIPLVCPLCDSPHGWRPDTDGADWSAYSAAKSSKNYNDARKFAKVLVDRHPDCVFAYISLASVCLQLKFTEEALAASRQAINLQPNDYFAALAWGCAGASYAESGQGEDAIAALRRAVTLKPDEWGFWDALGMGYREFGRSAEADAAFQRARELKSGSPATPAPSISISQTTTNAPAKTEPIQKPEKSADDEFQDLKQKAERGDAKAQVELGDYYHFGTGMPEDLQEAVKWYRKAAEQGYVGGQVDLGYCYAGGYGVTKDVVESVKWYRKAAEQGDALAQRSLGDSYHDGEGVTKDDVEAVMWYRKAAEQGDEYAQVHLSFLYFVGKGVAQDFVESAKLLRKAAEQDNTDGQCGLGVRYENGYGVPQDFVEAYKWYDLAATYSEKEAVNHRDQLSLKMTSEQIAEAQRRVAQFIEDHNNETQESS